VSNGRHCRNRRVSRSPLRSTIGRCPSSRDVQKKCRGFFSQVAAQGRFLKAASGAPPSSRAGDGGVACFCGIAPSPCAKEGPFSSGLWVDCNIDFGLGIVAGGWPRSLSFQRLSKGASKVPLVSFFFFFRPSGGGGGRDVAGCWLGWGWESRQVSLHSSRHRISSAERWRSEALFPMGGQADIRCIKSSATLRTCLLSWPKTKCSGAAHLLQARSVFENVANSISGNLMHEWADQKERRHMPVGRWALEPPGNQITSHR
jgi:hypothetical protein